MTVFLDHPSIDFLAGPHALQRMGRAEEVAELVAFWPAPPLRS
jgi:hypothetical protein